MTKTVRDVAAASEGSFQKHYAAIWSEVRWRESLYPALARPTRYCALVNRFVPTDCFDKLLQDSGVAPDDLQRVDFPCVSKSDSSVRTGLSCFTYKDDAGQFPAPAVAAEPQLMTHWAFDASSALVAHLLDVQPGEKVLDLCAAPGGKSIALSQRIWPSLHHDGGKEGQESVSALRDGVLCSNEADRNRHNKLVDNLKAYLPGPLFRLGRVTGTQADGSEPTAHHKLSVGARGFARVLVDAPCSSERHIIHAHNTAVASGRTATEMANWRAGSTKRLQKTQLELLQTGLRAAQVGGTVIYATCSLEPGENDGVIEKLLTWIDKEAKKGARWSVTVGFNGREGGPSLEKELEADWAERTKYGWIVLPDHPSGGKWGPLFFARLNKIKLPS